MLVRLNGQDSWVRRFVCSQNRSVGVREMLVSRDAFDAPAFFDYIRVPHQVPLHVHNGFGSRILLPIPAREFVHSLHALSRPRPVENLLLIPQVLEPSGNPKPVHGSPWNPVGRVGHRVVWLECPHGHLRVSASIH